MVAIVVDKDEELHRARLMLSSLAMIVAKMCLMQQCTSLHVPIGVFRYTLADADPWDELPEVTFQSDTLKGYSLPLNLFDLTDGEDVVLMRRLVTAARKLKSGEVTGPLADYRK